MYCECCNAEGATRYKLRDGEAITLCKACTDLFLDLLAPACAACRKYYHGKCYDGKRIAEVPPNSRCKNFVREDLDTPRLQGIKREIRRRQRWTF